MRSPMARFGAKILAITFFLTGFLLLDAFIAGDLTFGGFAMLAPAATLVAGGLVRLSARPVRKAKVRKCAPVRTAAQHNYTVVKSTRTSTTKGHVA